MATAVIMPRQGQSVESCVIGRWHKQKGDKVSIGDILFTYETDKAVFEEEAKVEGIVLDIFFKEGDEVECLKTVCVIGSEGESVDEFRAVTGDPAPRAPSALGPEPTMSTESSQQIENWQAAALVVSSGTRISPRARALAQKTGADIGSAVPTGANNRIMERDIQKVIAEGRLVTPAARESYSHFSKVAGTGLGGRVTTFDMQARQDAASDFEEVKLSNIRKVIAKTMHASLSNAAQLTLHSSFDATDVFAFRKNLKAINEHKTPVKITVTDIIIYAASRVLLKHKSINSHFLDDKIAVYHNAHIGVAVDTPRGLLVPTISHANNLSLTELSAQAKVLFEKCRQGATPPDVLKGATFTISNLGGLGIEMFTPILNPPQTGLLGVCSVVERTKDGKPYPAMGLSLTFDHRALDGADAARFLKDLIQYLETFSFSYVLEGGLL